VSAVLEVLFRAAVLYGWLIAGCAPVVASLVVVEVLGERRRRPLASVTRLASRGPLLHGGRTWEELVSDLDGGAGGLS
jgi:hypothetical protein